MMKRPIIEINYRNDFDFILTLKSKDGKVIGFPEYDFEGKITSEGRHGIGRLTGYDLCRPYEFSKRGKILKNCFDDNGKLHIVMNHHHLGPGRLMLEFVSYLPNPMYADGFRRVEHKEPLMIELVEHCGDSNLLVSDEEIIMPYVYKTAYDLAVAGGYEGSEADFEEALSKIGGIYTLSQESSKKIEKLIEKVRNLTFSEDTLAKRIDKLKEKFTAELNKQEQKIEEEVGRLLEGNNETLENLTSLRDEFLEAKNGIEKSIEEESKRAKDAEEALQQILDTLERTITEEGTRAKSREDDIDLKLGIVDSYVKEALKLYQNSVYEEQQRAQGKESELNNQIATLTKELNSKADSIEEKLNQALEKKLLKDSEQDLAILTETNARKSETERLDARIDNLKTLIKGNTSSIEQLRGDESEVGSVAHAIKDAKHYTDDAVHALDDKIEPVGISEIQGWFKKGLKV